MLEMVGSAKVRRLLEGKADRRHQETSALSWHLRRTQSSRPYGGSCTAWSSASLSSMGPVSHARREAGSALTYFVYLSSGTGEHGVGIGKREFLVEELGAGTVAQIKRIKCAIDPLGIMSPGKVRPHGACAVQNQIIKTDFC